MTRQELDDLEYGIRLLRSALDAFRKLKEGPACSWCGGLGRMADAPCQHCDGAGVEFDCIPGSTVLEHSGEGEPQH